MLKKRSFKLNFIDGSHRIISEQYARGLISRSDRLYSIVNKRMKQYNASTLLSVGKTRNEIKNEVFMEMWNELIERGKILLDTYLVSLEVIV